MRELLLTQGNLSRKLRQLIVFTTILLTLPQTTWGEGYYTTGNVTDASSVSNPGTTYIWETTKTVETSWRWAINNEQLKATITNNSDKLIFTLQKGGSFTLSIDGQTASTPDNNKLRKLILYGISSDLDVSAQLVNDNGNGHYDFNRLGEIFTPTGEMSSFSTDGVLNVTITNDTENSVTCTISSITILTGGETISSNELVWPDNAEDEDGNAFNGITKSVSNNVTTLSGNCAANTVFKFPLKRINETQGLNDNHDIAYSSSNTSVAEVGNDFNKGYVYIHGYGETTITATLTENENYSYEQSTYSYTLTNTESYGLTVAGVQVTSANANNITGDYITGTVTFEPASNNNGNKNTLILSGASINSYFDDAIKASITLPLYINLIGANTISCNGHSAFNVSNGLNFQSTGATPGSLTITNTSGVTTTTFSNVTPTYENSLSATSSDANTVVISTTGSTPTSYGLTVAGVEVTSANALNVLNDAYSSVSYDSGENTLTLKGVLLNDTDDDIVLSSAVTGLKINLVGCNTIGDISVSSAALTFTTSSTLPGCLKLNNISGNSTLAYENNILSWDATNNIIKARDNNENLSSSYVTGNIQSVNGDGFMYSTPALQFFGASLQNGQYVTVSPESNNSTYVYPTDYDYVNNLTKIYFQFDWGANTTNHDVNMKIKGVHQETPSSYYVDDDTSYSEDISLSSYGNGDIVEVTLNEAVTSDNIGLFFTSDNDFSFVPITVGFLKTESSQNTENYDLWIGDTQVTSANISDYSGVSFNASTNTLSLENAEITSQLKYTGTADLVISLKGDNSISSTTTSSALLATSDSEPYISIIKGEGATDASLDLSVTNNASATAYEGFTIGTNFLGEGLYGLVPSTIATGSARYVITTKAYGLMVGGDNVQYYSEDLPCYKDNILGDNLTNGGTATATFNPTGNILTLNNASITASNSYNFILSNLNELTICVKGNNTLTCNVVPLYSHNNNAPLTIVKDDTDTNEAQLILKAEGASSTPAIYGFGSLTYTGFTPYSVTTDGGRGSEITITYNSNHELDRSEVCLYTPATSTTTYDLTVAGVAVTDANASTGITGTGITGTVTFTPASDSNGSINTLTLNGATINGTIESSLGNLTIAFQGTNSLTGTSGYITSTDNTASLTLQGGTGTSTLSLTNSTSKSAVEGFVSVTLDGAYLKANYVCKYNVEDKAYKYSDGFNVQNLQFTTTHYYPLWVGSIQVHDGNKDDIFDDTAESEPISATFTPSSNILTLNGVSIDSSNGIESGLNSLVINLKGNNYINTNTAGHYNPIYSIETAPLTIQKAADATNCELILSSSSGEPQMIKGFSSVSYTELNFASKTGTTLDATTTKDATLSSATIYPLWVGETLVTGTTTSGTGWSYDANSNTLTLTNYTKTDYDGHAFISNMANLNVYLVGTNTVSKDALSAGKAFYTTYPDATLTFSTNESSMGTLDASGYNTFCEGFAANGIYCNNGLGYYPSSNEIKAKATPTISFAKWNATDNDYTGSDVGADEVLQAWIGETFKAPKPTFNNGSFENADTARYVYSYSVDGVAEFPIESTDATTGKITYGEINILKAGTVTITCTFPGNLQNNPCSASYTLWVSKVYVMLSVENAPATAFIDVSGNWHWGTGPYINTLTPVINRPDDATAYTYTSSNEDVATVNSTTGEVTPVGPGSTTITFEMKDDPKYNDATASYVVNVMGPATISFANATASVLSTETYTQTATVVPAGSTVTYSTNNDDVSVDANGVVSVTNPNNLNSTLTNVTITATVTAVPDANPQYYYVIENNDAFQTTYELTVSKPIMNNLFKSGQSYATFCNSDAEDWSLPEGIKAYAVQIPSSGNEVILKSIGFIPGTVDSSQPIYTPVLLMREDASNSSFGTVTKYVRQSGDEIPVNHLKFTTADKTTDGSQFILYNNEFVKAKGTISGPACYLENTTANPARYFTIGDDDATAIDNVQMTIDDEAGAQWYDLQGRKIQKPTKAGLYIMNGKKKVVNNK